MRISAQIETDVHSTLKNIPEIKGVSRVGCHYLNQQLTINFAIDVDPSLPIKEATIIAEKGKNSH